MSRRRREFPFKDLPLNLAGESVRERQFDVLFMRGMRWGIVGFIALSFVVQEWLRWLLKTPNSPGTVTVICVAVAIPSLIVFRRALREGWTLRMAALGERIVAEYLDGLKQHGYFVFHDIEQDEPKKFNIDHVAIGPGGVFVVETKTRSKWSDDRDVHVTYDGTSIRVNGFTPDRDPIRQVEAQAARVAELLGDANAPIRPIVTFPGWWVEPQPRDVRVWVLSAKAIPKWILKAPK
ncbi:MAG TPA: nuclease-related domain-containing protein, partial [Phycisphaerae bacterium]|nr:nuclease-related domain-containing protein [Phycisphaerae bacterium]